MRKIILLLSSCFFMSFCFAQNDVLTEELQNILKQKNDELIDINILLKQQMPAEHLTHLNAKSDSKEVRREIVINELKKFSEQQQESVMAVIEAEAKNGNVTDINAHWLVNSINCKASRDVVYQLASHPDIKVMGLNKEDVVTEGYDEKDAAPTRGTIASHVTHIQAEKVWDLGYTGKGVTVAVLDSGCNLDHVDIKDHLWTGNANGGYNFMNPGQRPMDNKGHGSHCAGIVCGDGTSGVSTGIAPDATLMVLKVNDTGGTEFDVMVEAIEYAVENGADIISISIGWWAPEASRKEIFRELFENALEANVVVAAAAGNNRESLATYPAPNNINSPADCPPPYLHEDQTLKGGVSAVISVGGVDEENNIIGVSSQGPVTWQNTTYGDYAYNPDMGLIRPDIVAQGASVKSLAHNSNTDHAIKAGTSMAAPAVAGVMALMLEKNPNLTPAELCRIIEETATPLSQTKSNDFGSGCINALAAVQAVSFDVQGAYLNKYNYTRNFNTGTNQNLELTLVNNGATATSGATTVTLTSNDSNVTVANGSATISNTIDVNGTATCNFTINVSNLSPDNHVAKLTVTTSGGSNNSFEIELNILNELVAPSNITTQVQNLRDVNLSWEATNNATSYNVYRDGNYIANTASTSYSDAGLEYGTLYTYTITSKRNELESESSREIRVLTGDNPEAPSPTNVTVANNNTVSWTNSTGSKSSNVYRKESSSEEVQLASKIDGTSYTDNTWNTLQNGIYQYGVSNNHASEENIYKQDFTDLNLTTSTSIYEAMNAYWYQYKEGDSNNNNWSIATNSTTTANNNTTTFDAYMGNAAFIKSQVNKPEYLTYLVSRQMNYTQYAGSNAKLSFYYITPAWGSDINTLKVMVSTSSYTGTWTEIWSSNTTDVSEWTKAEVNLSNYIDQTFYIAFVNVAGYGYCTGLDEVSINVEGNKESRIQWSDNIYKGINVFTQDGDMNNADNWATNNIPSASDNVIIDANAVVNGIVEVNSLTINEGASLTLNAGAKLIVNGDFVNTDADAFVINDGAQVIQSNEDVAATFKMEIDNPIEWSTSNKTGWQFIASPVEGAKIFDFTDVTGDYDLYRYDGTKNLEWINHKDENDYEEEEPTITIDTITAVEDNTVNAFIPSNINYDYTISQQIYTVDDLQGKNGKILSYSFQNAKNLTNGDNTRKFKVYMKNTAKTSFSGNSDWVSMQESDLVFDGNVSYTKVGEWVTINFDTPFEYESGKNIILCVYDNTNSWYQSTTNYYGKTTIDNRSIYKFRDDISFNVSSVGVTGTPTPFVGNAKFVFESGGTGGGGGQEPEDPDVPTVPAAPEVTAEAISSSSIKLTWEAVDGATSYNVYSVGHNIATITETNYTVGYLSSNTEYCFSVSAVNELGESAQTEACATTQKAKPIAPEVTATPTGESTIKLSWYDVNNATHYNVYKGEEFLARITEITYTVEGLEAETQYCFTVTAENEVGVSDKSEEKCATTNKKAPTIVEVGINPDGSELVYLPVYDYSAYSISQQIYTSNDIALGSGKIRNISFRVGDKGSAATRQYEVYLKNITASSFQENGYEYFELSSSDKVYDGNVAVGNKQEWFTIEFTTDFEYTGGNVVLCVYDKTGTALNNSSYHNFYKYAASGRSLYNSGYNAYNPTTLATSASGMATAYVNQIRFGIVPDGPVAPAMPSLSAVATSSSEISLTWNSVPGATRYNVYQGNNKIAEGLTETAHVVGNLEAGTEYCFAVTAVNEIGESAKSEACVTTEEAELPKCIVDFILTDQYTDGWNGNYLRISYDDGTPEENLTLEFGEQTKTFVKEISKGTAISVVYQKGSGQYTYPTENSFVIKYESGEIIAEKAQGSLSGTTTIGTFTIDCTPSAPQAPVLTAKAIDATSITLSWEAVTGAESYKVYQDGNSIATDLTETTYDVADLTAGEEYCFTVTAVNNIGESEHSEEACATLEEPGAAPTTFFYDFEDGKLDDFVITDTDGDGHTWNIYAYGINGNSLASESYIIGTGALSPNNRIVTKEKYNITAQSKLSFNFFNTFDEPFDVEVSINGTEFTSVYNRITKANPAEAIEISLAAYAGQNVYIALRHYNCNDGLRLMIDNLTLTDGSAVSRSAESHDNTSAEIASSVSESESVSPTNSELKDQSSELKAQSLYTILDMEPEFEKESSVDAESSESNNATRGAFETAFQQGVGYMASYEKEQTATFKGNLNNEKSYVFPVSYDSEKDLANFYLLGNPFSFNMKWSNVTTNNLASGYAVVNEEGGYTYLGSDGDEIKVGDGFFVKATSENPSISYSEGRTLRNVKSQSIDVVITGNAGSDNVLVNLGKAGEEGFPKLKNFNEEIATIFVYDNEKSYGVYNCDEDVNEVPIYLNNTNGIGKYTISIDAKGNFEDVTLVDLFSGDETNMLVHDYNFTTSLQEDTKRFVLKFVNGQKSTDDGHFVYQSGEELIINTQGTVQIIDVVGRVVYNDVVLNESQRINISGFTTGTYIVRVVNDNDVMTQKIVVY